jgi:hypothetical protein
MRSVPVEMQGVIERRARACKTRAAMARGLHSMWSSGGHIGLLPLRKEGLHGQRRRPSASEPRSLRSAMSSVPFIR